MMTSVVLAITPAAGSRSSSTPSRVGVQLLSAISPPYQPCPIATVPTTGARSPRPTLPQHDQARPTVGGEGLATTGLTIPAAAPRPPAKLTATSWVVADLDTGAVLGACGPHEFSPPASVQKLLLAATLLDKLDPNQVVTATQADLDIEAHSSAVGLLLGGKYPVKTLWLGLMLNSGNDAANALARVGGGAAGVKGTLQAMNDEARHLGAYETHAVTPSGLDGTGQFTSAYDLALIARVCFNRPDCRQYNSALRAQIPAQPPKDSRGFQIQNDDQLLYQYPGAIGGKTGFTDFARHTFVGAAQRNGRRLVVTLLNAEATPLRGWQQGAALLDWGFSLPHTAAVGRLVSPGETEATPSPSTLRAAGAGGSGAHAAGLVRTGAQAIAVVVGTALAVVVIPLMLYAAASRRRRRRRLPAPRHVRGAPARQVRPAGQVRPAALGGRREMAGGRREMPGDRREIRRPVVRRETGGTR
jgi:D-alanyl-D-alanine carboxypeptidase (penicillin-binding protein 5/6)